MHTNGIAEPDRNPFMRGVKEERDEWIRRLRETGLLRTSPLGPAEAVETLRLQLVSARELEREAIKKIVQEHGARCASGCAGELLVAIRKRAGEDDEEDDPFKELFGGEV